MHDDVLPEPFIGNITAPVVLLNLNPGFDTGNIEEHARSGFQALIRSNYSQECAAFPFYYLDPRFETAGRQWWEKKLRYLLASGMFQREQLAERFLLIEYFPYHSRRFAHRSLELQSQEFGFGLARSAIAREAVVVVMRAVERWRERIPELRNYSRAFALRSPQNVVLSPGNCPPGGFDLLVSAIRAVDDC